MKPPLDWLLRLYPAAWRARCQAKLAALIGDTGGLWRHIPGVVWEAAKLRAVTWRFVPALATLGLAIAGCASLAIPNRYVSRSVLQIVPVRLPDAGVSMPRFRTLQHSLPQEGISVRVGMYAGRHREGEVIFTPGATAPDRRVAQAAVALQVLHPANLPVRPHSPNRPVIVLVGLLLGTLAATGVLLLRPEGLKIAV